MGKLLRKLSKENPKGEILTIWCLLIELSKDFPKELFDLSFETIPKDLFKELSKQPSKELYKESPKAPMKSSRNKNSLEKSFRYFLTKIA